MFFLKNRDVTEYRRLVVVVAWSWWMEAWSGRCRQHQSSERMEADGLEIRNSLVNDLGHIFLTCFTRRFRDLGQLGKLFFIFYF